MTDLYISKTTTDDGFHYVQVAVGFDLGNAQVKMAIAGDVYVRPSFIGYNLPNLSVSNGKNVQISSTSLSQHVSLGDAPEILYRNNAVSETEVVVAIKDDPDVNKIKHSASALLAMLGHNITAISQSLGITDVSKLVLQLVLGVSCQDGRKFASQLLSEYKQLTQDKMVKVKSAGTEFYVDTEFLAKNIFIAQEGLCVGEVMSKKSNNNGLLLDFGGYTIQATELDHEGVSNGFTKVYDKVGGWFFLALIAKRKLLVRLLGKNYQAPDAARLLHQDDLPTEVAEALDEAFPVWFGYKNLAPIWQQVRVATLTKSHIYLAGGCTLYPNFVQHFSDYANSLGINISPLSLQVVPRKRAIAANASTLAKRAIQEYQYRQQLG